MTLVQFLLARIAEDEAGPWQHDYDDDTYADCCCRVWTTEDEADCTCDMPKRRQRMLAECEAKRKIIQNAAPVDGPPIDDFSRGWDVGAGLAVRYLAQVHADRPDYSEEWKP